MSEKAVLDIQQAAEYLDISADTLYRYVKEGTVPGLRMGNRWKFPKVVLDRWMADKCCYSLKKSAVPDPKKKPIPSPKETVNGKD